MRRGCVVAILAVVLVLGLLVVATQLLPGPSAPVPTATPTPTLVAASATESNSTSIPTATPRSRLGLPDPNRTPGTVNPAATEATLDETICKSGWAASVRPPSAYTGALKLVQIVQYGYADKNPSYYEEDKATPSQAAGAVSGDAGPHGRRGTPSGLPHLARLQRRVVALPSEVARASRAEGRPFTSRSAWRAGA